MADPSGSSAGPSADRPEGSAFHVHLDVFDGPFDVLLSLIAKHQLDVTEVALARVTDDFLAHVRQLGPSLHLAVATEFLVVAATLLDLKAARLLPGVEEDNEDVALLEARDMLFARLLQYRAYKQAAAHLADLIAEESRHVARSVSPEPAFAAVLPPVRLGVGPLDFAALAARVLAPRPPTPQVVLDHVHGSTVSVPEQVEIIAARLRADLVASFAALTADCTGLEVVARFLGLLGLYRDGAARFEQDEPLGELLVHWTGSP